MGTPIFEGLAEPTAPADPPEVRDEAPIVKSVTTADTSIKLAERLAVIVPSRGRPDIIYEVANAWLETGAEDHGLLVVALDQDEPTTYDIPEAPWIWTIRTDVSGMAPTVNAAARQLAEWGAQYLAVQNDDHRPRTAGWVGTYIEALDELRARHGVGVVYGDDLLRGETLCTEWAVTASWVATLGRMVPSLVRHQYADTSVRDLARAVGCLRFLSDVTIEHMHPTALDADGNPKREWDATTTAANARARRDEDRRIYDRWTMRQVTSTATGLARQAAALRSLRP